MLFKVNCRFQAKSLSENKGMPRGWGFFVWPRREGSGNPHSGLFLPEQRRPSEKDTPPFGREPERPPGRVDCSVTAGKGMLVRSRLAIRPFWLTRGNSSFSDRL